MNTADLLFNIIYTPGTVRYLQPFLLSLLEWTDCRFRVVLNGVGADESALLMALCENNPRLELVTVSATDMLGHGETLNWLHERTDADYFCFIDTDIAATGPFLDDVMQRMENCDVFSTGYPLWYSPEDLVQQRNFRRWHGINFRAADGITLSGTYFAVFDNAVLTRAMQSTGVDFRIYRWTDVPEQHRDALRAAGLNKLEYDTGKLLMCLMHLDGVRFCEEDLPAVRHLGAFASRAADEPEYYYRGPADKVAVKFAGGMFSRPLLYLADCWYALSKPSPGVSEAESKTLSFTEKRIIAARIRKRRNTARYFMAVTAALAAGKPLPPVPPMGCKDAERRIAAGAQVVTDVYAKHFRL